MDKQAFPLAAVAAALALAGCGGGGSDQAPDPAHLKQGQDIFRFDTFGDETKWTDTLRMHEVVRSAVDPATALSVGLKVDSVALPANISSDERGARLAASTVLLAVDPLTARELMGSVDWPQMRPVIASCLDVALSKLPQPKRKFAIGIDQPLYFSVHSAWAQLTPRGGALIHTARYGGGA